MENVQYTICNMKMATQIEDDCNLKLFQTSIDHEINPSLNRIIKTINTFIDLNYLSNEDAELKLTSAGIKYLNKNYQKYINDIRQTQAEYSALKDVNNMVRSQFPLNIEAVVDGIIDQFNKSNDLLNINDGSNNDESNDDESNDDALTMVFLNKTPNEINM